MDSMRQGRDRCPKPSEPLATGAVALSAPLGGDGERCGGRGWCGRVRQSAALPLPFPASGRDGETCRLWAAIKIFGGSVNIRRSTAISRALAAHIGGRDRVEATAFDRDKFRKNGGRG